MKQYTHRMSKMSDEELSNVLKRIMDEKNNQVSYEDMLLSLDEVWLSSGMPKVTRDLRRFIRSAYESKRSPEWYKQWYTANIARPIKPVPNQPTPQVRKMLDSINSELSEGQKQRNDARKSLHKMVESKSQMIEKVKNDLFGIFSSGQFLVNVGVMDDDDVVEMAKVYMNKVTW